MPPSLPPTMRAIHLPTTFLPASAPYPSLQPSSIPTPSPSSPTNLLIAVTHASLNHVDLLYSKGLHQNNASGLVKPPLTLGLEFAGIVVALPSSSSSSSSSITNTSSTTNDSATIAAKTNFALGDRVWGSTVGAFAEYVSVPATAVRKLPATTSLLDAAGLGAASPTVSYGALKLCADVQPGDVVLVHSAAGGLGWPAVQICLGLGARVVAAVGGEGKKGILTERLRGAEGVLGVVSYGEEGWEGEVLRLARGCGKEGVDVVFDPVGLVLGSIRCVRFGGMVVIVGFAGRKGEMEKVAMNRILLKNARVLGYRYGESGRRDPSHPVECWRGTEELLAQGKMKPLIYEVHKGLESVGEGLQELYDRKVWGKAVVEVRAEEDIIRELSKSKSML